MDPTLQELLEFARRELREAFGSKREKIQDAILFGERLAKYPDDVYRRPGDLTDQKWRFAKLLGKAGLFGPPKRK